MWSVTRLGRECGLSRSTILYYEEIGLMRKPPRTGGNYRAYGEPDLVRLRQISMYREAGLKLTDIRSILNQPQTDAAVILRRRFAEIAGEIERMRRQQAAIAELLKASGKFRRTTMITKEKWVTIMRQAGLTDDDMHCWHQEFESAAPEEHQQFLEFLRIGKEEIQSIREWSRAESGR